MVLREPVPPVTVGVEETLSAVVDNEDATEELDVTEAVVLPAEADVDDEAAPSVADCETVAAVVLASSCRGSGCATPAKTTLKHTKKQRRALHIRGDGPNCILQTRRCGTGALQRLLTSHTPQCPFRKLTTPHTQRENKGTSRTRTNELDSSSMSDGKGEGRGGWRVRNNYSWTNGSTSAENIERAWIKQ